MTAAVSRRTVLKGMAGLAGAVALGACNPSPPQPGERRVRVSEWTALGYPSPFGYAAGPGYWRMSLLFDTLTWPDSTGSQLPWLASSYRRSEDGLVYTVELRDVAWDDGAPLTAGDVVFTYGYYTTNTWTPLLIGVPRPGVDVIATGPRTVEFRLPRPDATFLQRTLGTMPIVPEHVWSKIEDPMSVTDPKLLVSTGPYTLAARDAAKGTELYVAKEGYFLGTPYVRRIEMLPARNYLNALKVNKLDSADSNVEGVRDDALKPFRNNPQYGLISQEAAFAFPLFFNLSKGGALADVRFRRACLHAIDRADLITRVLTGNGQAGSQGWLPPSHSYFDPGAREYPFDRSQSERLLDEAGYRRRPGNGPRTNLDGTPLRLVLYIPVSVPETAAELITANLKSVGVEIDLERTDLVRLFGLKTQKTYDLLVTSYPGPSGIGPSGDPDILRGVYHSSPPNPLHHATGYSNPTVDRLLDAQVAATDLDERRRMVGQIQRLVAEDLPVAVLYYTTLFQAFRKRVFDQWYYTPGGFGPGIFEPYNKHAYITGRKEGLQVRRAAGSGGS